MYSPPAWSAGVYQSPAPAITPRTGYYIGTEELIERRADPATLLLDVRTDEEAHDDVNDTLPLGRIPGSVPFPWTNTLRDEFVASIIRVNLIAFHFRVCNDSRQDIRNKDASRAAG